jgi:hypothetical protein
MITKSMKLTTRRDAHQWASTMLEGANEVTAAVELAVSDYLWRCFPGWSYGQAKKFILNDEDFFKLAYGEHNTEELALIRAKYDAIDGHEELSWGEATLLYAYGMMSKAEIEVFDADLSGEFDGDDFE